MISIRRFCAGDAQETEAVVKTTIKISNSKDYSQEHIQRDIEKHSKERLLNIHKNGSLFVACDGQKIVGCGGIVGYFGSLTESFITTVFVLPEYQRQGVGTKIISAIEQDQVFLRATRTEIAASITGCGFYVKLGYSYKNGITEPDEIDGCIRLEKFRKTAID